jgi:hypothetical protein
MVLCDQILLETFAIQIMDPLYILDQKSSNAERKEIVWKNKEADKPSSKTCTTVYQKTHERALKHYHSPKKRKVRTKSAEKSAHKVLCTDKICRQFISM